MLLDNFYTFTDIAQEEGKISALIEINKEHAIFEGHFPSVPIVPGVCQVLMVTEILSECLHLHLHLKAAKSIKFLSLINPNELNKLHASITYRKEEDIIKANAVLSCEGKNYLKLIGEFSERK